MSEVDFLGSSNAAIRELAPYQPGKPIVELQREFGISKVIKLASNENPLGPSKLAVSELQSHIMDLHRYPDGSGYELKHKLAQINNVQTSNITLANGSDEIFNLVLRVFAGPTSEIIVSQYAFAAYAIAVRAMGAKLVIAPASNWGHDLPAMLNKVTTNTKIVFIANPNNPTGTWNTTAEVESFMQQLPQHVLVVIDQAYFEYLAHTSDYPNAINWLSRYPNLIVTRTFSKAYGLAGIRVGYAAASSTISDLLNRVRLPFNVNSLALQMAYRSLDDKEHIKRTLQINQQGMQQFINCCDKLGLAYIPSKGNFITIDFGANAGAVYQKMLAKGIILRPLAVYGMGQHLRISIGLEQENAICIDALQGVLGSL